MADNTIMMEVYDVVSVDVAPADETVVVAALPIEGDQGPAGPAGIQGPAGPQGLQGLPGSFTGPGWWYGEGPPGTLVGSHPGDYYVDTSSGNIYKLGD